MTNQWYREKRKQLIQIFGGECNAPGCHETEGLEFAHIEETGLKGEGRGFNARVLDVLHNIDKYALLCHKHHGEYDGCVPGDDLPTDLNTSEWLYSMTPKELHAIEANTEAINQLVKQLDLLNRNLVIMNDRR